MMSVGRTSLFLGVAIVCSALCLVYSSHRCRAYYADLQGLEISRWELEESYSRLLIEYSTLGSPHRVAQIAGNDLGMAAPEVKATELVPLSGGGS